MYNGCLDHKIWTKNYNSTTAGNFFVNKVFSEREKYADIFRYLVFWLKWIFACVGYKRVFCPKIRKYQVMRWKQGCNMHHKYIF